MVVSQAKLIKVNIKHDGNKTKTAKELGISVPAVSKRINNNPAIKNAILNVREEAMKKAGITRTKVYKVIAEGLKANQTYVVDGTLKTSKIADRKERRENAKLSLLLFKDLEPDKEYSVNNIANVVYNVLINTNRKVVEVV